MYRFISHIPRKLGGISKFKLLKINHLKVNRKKVGKLFIFVNCHIVGGGVHLFNFYVVINKVIRISKGEELIDIANKFQMYSDRCIKI